MLSKDHVEAAKWAWKAAYGLDAKARFHCTHDKRDIESAVWYEKAKQLEIDYCAALFEQEEQNKNETGSVPHPQPHLRSENVAMEQILIAMAECYHRGATRDYAHA